MAGFFAHSANSVGIWDDLTGHLQRVAEMARTFAGKFNGPDFGYWAGLWHDLGKFSAAFQDYLHHPEAGRGPDHSSAGAIFAARHCDLLAFLVAGHHAGLDSPSKLKNRLAEKQPSELVKQALERAAQVVPTLAPPGCLDAQLPAFTQPRGQPIAQCRLSLEMFLRLLFSALVDADFLDTEQHFQSERAEQRGVAPSLTELWQRFDVNQQCLTAKTDTPLQEARHAIYLACLAAAELLPGWFRLTVPTGGGKTRSGMAFALRHALRHGLDRVIFAIPYTSIIEQTADVYRDIFQGAGVLEHHSAVADHPPQNSPVTAAQQWSRLASENWDAPVVVTTTVQLFESLLAHRPNRCRKLHRLAHSVLVLDEVQTLPPHLLNPILDVLGELVRHYHVTVVCCTATQPALTTNRYLRGVADVREIVPEPERYFRQLERVRYELPGGRRWAWEEVASELRTGPQALAVVNTKKDALALLDALGDDPTALHLSTQMCGVHRAETVKEVKARLAEGRPCRLVATQVVEAGVDIDFPLVLRAIGPLDRIVQAAGRCNREGKLPDRGRVVIFDPKEGGAPPGAYRTGQDIAEAMLRAGCDLHDPQTYEHYFAQLFGAVDTDARKIQELRQALDFPEVARRFQMIDDDGVPVIVRPPGHEKKVEKLLAIIHHAAEPPRWVFRQLQRFTVTVRSRQVFDYEAKGLLRAITPGLYEWQGSYDRVRKLVDAAHDPDLLVF